MEERRLARRLAAAGISIRRVADGGAEIVGADGAARGLADRAALDGLIARGAMIAVADGCWRLSEAGRAMVRRMLAGGDGFAEQHQRRAPRVVEHEGARHAVMVDLSESPLAWLRARKDREGRPLIDDAAFAAGERLRADFTRGQLTPSVTASWSPTAGAARRSGPAGGIAELTEAALSARMRVERALDALGPELSGAILDFCCFLKGIEQIERERNWPQRSAKLVIRLGLAALARHYGIANRAVGPERAAARRRG